MGKGFHLQMRIFFRGQDDHRNIFRLGIHAQPTQQHESINIGHDQILQDDRWGKIDRRTNGHRRITAIVKINILLCTQIPLNNFTDHLLIVNQ